jgi:hypothetical protein
LQNEEAEELMRAVEREEEAAAGRTPAKLTLHLCIINMVIGTLYCSKVSGWWVGLGRGEVGREGGRREVVCA